MAVLIENEGALFRGFSQHHPTEVWSEREKRWKPYTGRTPKPEGWGEVIDQATADQITGAVSGQAKAS